MSEERGDWRWRATVRGGSGGVRSSPLPISSLLLISIFQTCSEGPNLTDINKNIKLSSHKKYQYTSK